MRRDDYLDAIRQLGLSPLDYIVTGSGVLGALGLREAGDIDLVVSQAVYEQFESAGTWQRKYYTDGTYGLVNGIYEAGLDWDSETGQPNLHELKQDETVIDGIPFASLPRLREWKQKMGRQKDLTDIRIIDRYLGPDSGRLCSPHHGAAGTGPPARPSGKRAPAAGQPRTEPAKVADRYYCQPDGYGGARQEALSVARLAIDRDFLDDYSKLPKPVQGRVKAAIDKFAEHVHAGLHLEKFSHSRDDRIRTIRIDQFWRGVVLAPDAGDTYSLIRVIEGRELDSLWAAAVAEAGLAFAPTFLNREWEQVILAQDLGTELDYLIASRAGQGTPLGRPQRRQVWALAQRVESRLRALGRDTFTQLANEAARALRDGAVRLPYRHVIIDEAQDLHPAQWRLLRAAVPAGPKTKRSSRTGACFTRTAK